MALNIFVLNIFVSASHFYCKWILIVTKILNNPLIHAALATAGLRDPDFDEPVISAHLNHHFFESDSK